MTTNIGRPLQAPMCMHVHDSEIKLYLILAKRMPTDFSCLHCNTKNLFFRMTTPSGADESDALGFGYVKKKVKEVLKIEDIDDDDVTQSQDHQVIYNESFPTADDSQLRQMILNFSLNSRNKGRDNEAHIYAMSSRKRDTD